MTPAQPYRGRSLPPPRVFSWDGAVGGEHSDPGFRGSRVALVPMPARNDSPGSLGDRPPPAANLDADALVPGTPPPPYSPAPRPSVDAYRQSAPAILDHQDVSPAFALPPNPTAHPAPNAGYHRYSARRTRRPPPLTPATVPEWEKWILYCWRPSHPPPDFDTTQVYTQCLHKVADLIEQRLREITPEPPSTPADAANIVGFAGALPDPVGLSGGRLAASIARIRACQETANREQQRWLGTLLAEALTMQRQEQALAAQGWA